MQRALHARPEVFDGVRVNATVNVGHAVVDEVVDEVTIRLPVRAQRVGVERRTRHDVLVNARDQRRRLVIRDDHRASARLALTRAALHHAEDRRFTGCRATDGNVLADRVRARGQVLMFAADERLVRFDLAREHRRVRVLHRLADAVQHEPRGFLRHTERATQFVRRGSVFRVREQPHGREPLGERDRRMLENARGLGRKVALAVLAAPQATGLDELDGRRSAAVTRARHAVRPAAGNDVGVGPAELREVGDGFEQGGRRPVHAPRLYRGCARWVALPGAIGISS